MSVTLIIDSKQFDSALKLYRQASKRDLSYILNRAGANIAFKAIQYTPKADAKKIENQLRAQTGSRIAGKRGILATPKSPKAASRRGIYKATPLAFRIVGAKLARKGTNIQSEFGSRGDVDAYINKIIASRKRTVGFLKSGWFAAARAFQGAIKGNAGSKFKGALDFGTQKGTYTLAVPSDSPIAMLTNSAVNPKSGTSPDALIKYGSPALQKAVNAVAADMREWAQRKLAETASKYSGK